MLNIFHPSHPQHCRVQPWFGEQKHPHLRPITDSPLQWHYSPRAAGRNTGSSVGEHILRYISKPLTATAKALSRVMGKKSPLKMKSMPQTAFALQPSLLPQRQPPALEKQNLALPTSFSAFSSFPPCFSVVIAFLSGFGFCVWFAFGSCPLKRGPWVSWGLPVCFPVFPGEAGLTQLLWQPVFPRRAAKHVEPLRGEPGQHLLMEKPFQGVSSEPLTRANRDRLWVYSPASRASGSNSQWLHQQLPLKIHILQPVQGQLCILGSTPKLTL